MASWHKSQEEASRSREVNRAAKTLLVNRKTKKKTKTKTKRGNAEEEGGGEREGSVERALVVIASEQPVQCLFLCGFSFVYFSSIFYFAALIYLFLELLCS